MQIKKLSHLPAHPTNSMEIKKKFTKVRTKRQIQAKTKQQQNKDNAIDEKNED